MNNHYIITNPLGFYHLIQAVNAKSALIVYLTEKWDLSNLYSSAEELRQYLISNQITKVKILKP